MSDQDLRTYLETILGAGGDASGLESVSESERADELRESAQDNEELENALSGLEHFRSGADMSEDEQFALEAIILPRERPVIDVLFDTFHEPPSPWQHLAQNPFKEKIDQAILSVGRVEIPNHPSKPFGGTAFVVGENLLMTNRHVAETFASGVGIENLAFIPGRDPGIDFKQEVRPTTPEILKFDSLVLVHPWWDCALVQVQGLAAERKPLELAGSEPEHWQDSDVVIVGYPAKDPRNDQQLQDRIFNSIYQRKRMQPGKARSIEPIKSYGHMVEALTHDSSTLGGNSGSLILDPATGQVIGLHFGGIYKKANYAVPAWELARDARMASAGVKFRSAPTVTEPTPWEASWTSADPVAVPVEGVGSASGGASPSHGDGLSDFEWFERSVDAALKSALERDLEGTRQRLVAVLGEEEAEDLIEDLSPDVTEGIFGPDVDPSLPEIVYLHGIMGSHLENALGFGFRVWFHALAFARGNVAEKLTLEADGFTDARPGLRLGPDGQLKLKYGKASRKWRRRGFVVHELAYDWRKPVAASADQLHAFIEARAAAHPDKKLVLVAHSMGGLVSSLYAHRHPEWESRIERAVFVGSPLGGSYAPIEAVLGVYPFFRTLAKLSRDDGIEDLAKLAPTLPGLMEMLPSAELFPNDPDYRSAATWGGIGPLQKWLDLSGATSEAVLSSPLLARTSGIVSGRFGTVVSARTENGGLVAGSRNGAGDGTVPLRAAAISQLKELYEATGDKRHADMLNDKVVIGAAADLVSTGATTALDRRTFSDADFDATLVELESVEPSDEALEPLRERLENGQLTQEDLSWIFDPASGDPPQ